MRYRGEFLCAAVLALVSIIWFRRKKTEISEENSIYGDEIMNNMTLIIQKIEEIAIQIRNLTDENSNLRKLNAEQSEVLSQLYDCKQRLKDIKTEFKNSNSEQTKETAIVRSDIDKIKNQVDGIEKLLERELKKLRNFRINGTPILR